jgi:hypothetical protein
MTPRVDSLAHNAADHPPRSRLFSAPAKLMPEQLAQAIMWFVLLVACLQALVVALGMPGFAAVSLALGFVSAVLLTRGHLIAIACALGLSLVLSLVVASVFFDISFDGLDYHQDGIVAMQQVPALLGAPSAGLNTLWIDNYPKLSWWFGAAVSRTTGSVHLAKAINGLLILAAFASCLAALSDVKPRIYRWGLASAFALNPVAISQLFAHYVDGPLASCMVISVMASWGGCRGVLPRRDTWILMLLGLLGMAALKFTGLVFAVAILAFAGIRAGVDVWRTRTGRWREQSGGADGVGLAQAITFCGLSLVTGHLI